MVLLGLLLVMSHLTEQQTYAAEPVVVVSPTPLSTEDILRKRPVLPDTIRGQLRPPLLVTAGPPPRNVGSVADTSTPVPSLVRESPSITTPVPLSPGITPAPITATHPATYYVVGPGDTLYEIAVRFGVTLSVLTQVNGIANSNLLDVGQILAIPASDGSLPDPRLMPIVAASGEISPTMLAARGTITERMTLAAQQAAPTSPYYRATWVTFYGRPGIPVMGIVGAYPVDELTPLLRKEAEAYDRANGDALGVTPAFHLVYGMATKAPNDDNSHLAFLDDGTVMQYIQTAQKENFSVILDIQVGALTPVAAISRALPFLQYRNVHLAIDPEFAMSHPKQVWPGDPIGFVTAQQVNDVQAVMQRYMIAHQIAGPRILLVHQFLDTMIENPEKLDWTYDQIALTISVDGWGGPWGKISKYNAFVTKATKFAALKLFYNWDEPLLSPSEVMGLRPYTGTDLFIDITPNLIIFQ